MDALDGNAIGGLLLDVFDVEMTTAMGVCASCGAERQVAELVVYVQAPGTVVRCRSCSGLLMVFVEVMVRVDRTRRGRAGGREANGR